MPNTNNFLEKVFRVGIVLLVIGAMTVGLDGWIQTVGAGCLTLGILGTFFPAMVLWQCSS